MGIKFRAGMIAAALATAALSTAASAGVTINVLQSGSNVVATGAGTFVTGLSHVDLGIGSGFIAGNPVAIFLGSSNLITDYQGTITGPSKIGLPFFFAPADSTTGSIFGLLPEGLDVGGSLLQGIFLPTGFQSGGEISSTATFTGATLADLGLTPGQYIFSTAQDTITVNVGYVPEPATWAMMLIGFVGIGFAMRRKPVQAMLSA